METDVCSLPTSAAPAKTRTHPSQITLAPATGHERESIYRIRHAVYARELGQHAVIGAGSLSDSLDAWSVYRVAMVGLEIDGFISVPPAGTPSYSIDKYLRREALPFQFDAGLCEVRLLTVLRAHRGRELAFLLMYGAFRWVESRGGERIVAIGRREILDLYLRVGLKPVGQSITSGAVTYDVVQAEIAALRAKLPDFSGLTGRLEERTDWQFQSPFRKPAACFHGGTFFKAVGERFETLEKREAVINADVLDAWFPPSPRVLSVLREHLAWLLRTSPPTACEGLIEAIAEARGLTPANILAGAGSSDLIFRTLRHWLKPSSHALILDPSYGEYGHVLERVIGCTVVRLGLALEYPFEAGLH